MYDAINDFLKENIIELVEDHLKDKIMIIEVDAKPEKTDSNNRSIEMTTTCVVDIKRKDKKPKVSQIEQWILENEDLDLEINGETVEIEQTYQGTRTYLVNSTWGRQIKILYKYTRNY